MFLSALAFLVDRVIHDVKLANLDFLLVLHLNVLKNNFSSADMTLLPFVLPSQEHVPLLFGLLQAFISCLKPLHVLRPVVLNRMIGSIGNLLRLYSLCIEFNDRIPTEDILFFFVLFLELFLVVPLSLKLSPAFVLDCIECARVDFALLLYSFNYRL